MIWQKQLEERLQLPIRRDLSTPHPWADYVALSLYIYEQLWQRYPNGAGLFNESGYSALRYLSYDLMRGGPNDMTGYLETEAELVKTESVEDFIVHVEQLRREALVLKGEFERLALTELPLGSCPYVKVPLF